MANTGMQLMKLALRTASAMKETPLLQEILRYMGERDPDEFMAVNDLEGLSETALFVAAATVVENFNIDEATDIFASLAALFAAGFEVGWKMRAGRDLGVD